MKTSLEFASISTLLAIAFIYLLNKEDQAELEAYKKETIGVVSKAWMSENSNIGRQVEK